MVTQLSPFDMIGMSEYAFQTIKNMGILTLPSNKQESLSIEDPPPTFW